MHQPGVGWEAYSASSSLETLDLRESLVLPCLLGHSARSDEATESLNGQVPQLVVLFVQQHDQAGGLGVERGGDVQNSRVDELLDLGVWDGAVLAQLVDGAAVLGRLDEGVGRHC